MDRLVDIGANLTHESFRHDFPALLSRAAEAGVTHCIVTGTSVGASAGALQLARAHPQRLWATAGIHPHHATELNAEAVRELAALAQHPQVVSVGECGLDYYRDLAPRKAQWRAFAAQLDIAVECGKPVFLHERDAHADFVALVRDYRPRLSGGVAHCFTGGPAEIETCLSLDLHIGITGWICDERRGQALREAVRRLPLERLLVETDAPYLLPRDLHPQPAARRNEPAFLPHVIRALAHWSGHEPEAVAAAATENAWRLFRLDAVKD